ncbi:hypothetical protein PA905_20790 [Planktothrix agardhii CCAP 1459/11A]|uniref:Transposase n=1 Tax=Planktothrix agardhii CCAP 1459/11A TaxID=282420 RepID=A0A4P5ZZK6_PLAAG|nr:hypothetical protein [Planktothrix agardhii]GDZ94127.1 hypothetical protein PA905_20790 [Planktothrix agardhii CCAP 1459/11A]
MDVTSEEKDKLRQLFALESEQKQKLVVADKNSFKSWLEQVARGIAVQLGVDAIHSLWHWFLGSLG